MFLSSQKTEGKFGRTRNAVEHEPEASVSKAFSGKREKNTPLFRLSKALFARAVVTSTASRQVQVLCFYPVIVDVQLLGTAFLQGVF